MQGHGGFATPTAEAAPLTFSIRISPCSPWERVASRTRSRVRVLAADTLTHRSRAASGPCSPGGRGFLGTAQGVASVEHSVLRRCGRARRPGRGQATFAAACSATSRSTWRRQRRERGARLRHDRAARRRTLRCRRRYPDDRQPRLGPARAHRLHRRATRPPSAPGEFPAGDARRRLAAASGRRRRRRCSSSI